MLKINVWSDYIIRKGLFLSGILLTCAILMLVWADASPAVFPLLRRYAACYQNYSAVVMGSVLLGGLLLEDMARKTS